MNAKASYGTLKIGPSECLKWLADRLVRGLRISRQHEVLML